MQNTYWVSNFTYTEAGISISQYGYSEKILLRFGMSDSQPVATPLDLNMPLWKA